MPTVNDANGTPMRIRDNGFALSAGVSMAMEAHAAHNGGCYSLVYNIDPNMAGDFLYIKNSDEKTLRIYRIRGYTAGTGGLFTIKLGCTGTPTTGVDIVPVNALSGSGEAAEGTFNRNTSAASMALTGGDTFDILALVSAEQKEWDYSGEIALEKNQTFVMSNGTDPTAVMTWVLHFYYHEKIE